MSGLYYLCGPMAGLPDYNYPEFFRTAHAYRTRGYMVVNPAESFGGNVDLPHADYIKRALTDIQRCSGIILMPGWEKSRGAKLEAHIAFVLGFNVIVDEERCPRCKKQGAKDADRWWCLEHGEYGKEHDASDPVGSSAPYRNRLMHFDAAEDAAILRMSQDNEFPAIARELRRSVEEVENRYKEIVHEAIG